MNHILTIKKIIRMMLHFFSFKKAGRKIHRIPHPLFYKKLNWLQPVRTLGHLKPR